MIENNVEGWVKVAEKALKRPKSRLEYYTCAAKPNIIRVQYILDSGELVFDKEFDKDEVQVPEELVKSTVGREESRSEGMKPEGVAFEKSGDKETKPEEASTGAESTEGKETFVERSPIEETKPEEVSTESKPTMEGKALDEKSPDKEVKLGSTLQSKKKKRDQVEAFIEDFAKKNNRTPTPKEICAALDVSNVYARKCLKRLLGK